jgi:hypothetical protein
VFRAIAALVLASTTASSGDALSSTIPWWERVTVTIAGDGKPQSCRFESSLKPDGAKDCVVEGSQAALAHGSGAKEEYTRITFERRFDPGPQSRAASLEAGDMLLGRQVMALAIDSAGSVKGCKILAASGAMTPTYGCEEASTEKFEASADKASTPTREGVMTILVYGHSEHVV